MAPGSLFCCLDPVDQLPAEGRARWAQPEEWSRMLDEALVTAGGSPLPPA